MPRFRLAWECKGRAQRRTCEVAVGAGGFVRVPRSRLSIFQQGDSDLRKGVRIREGAEISPGWHDQQGDSDPRGGAEILPGLRMQRAWPGLEDLAEVAISGSARRNM